MRVYTGTGTTVEHHTVFKLQKHYSPHIYTAAYFDSRGKISKNSVGKSTLTINSSPYIHVYISVFVKTVYITLLSSYSTSTGDELCFLESFLSSGGKIRQHLVFWSAWDQTSSSFGIPPPLHPPSAGRQALLLWVIMNHGNWLRCHTSNPPAQGLTAAVCDYRRSSLLRRSAASGPWSWARQPDGALRGHAALHRGQCKEIAHVGRVEWRRLPLQIPQRGLLSFDPVPPSPPPKLGCPVSSVLILARLTTLSPARAATTERWDFPLEENLHVHVVRVAAASGSRLQFGTTGKLRHYYVRLQIRRQITPYYKIYLRHFVHCFKTKETLTATKANNKLEQKYNYLYFATLT